MIRTMAFMVAATVGIAPALAGAQQLETATFAGGCFWCVESDFDRIPGVVSTTSGYTGGTLDNPTYKQVTAGGSGHLEAVEITYDPAHVSYEELLEAFWHSVDPTEFGRAILRSRRSPIRPQCSSVPMESGNWPKSRRRPPRTNSGARS